MNSSSLAHKILLLFALVLAFALHAQAQQNTGKITGTVTDNTGAVIPKATIVVTNTDTNALVRTIHSDSKGLYVAPLLQVGTYSITASANGFNSKTVDALQVDVSSSLKVDFPLTPGETSSVTVTDANNLAPDLENGATATVISGEEIKDLALNTHNFEQLLQLQPGVSFGGSTDQIFTGLVSPSGDRGSAGVSINGLRPDQNGFLLDGMDMLEHNTGQSAVIFPAVDAIQQLRISRGSYGAEYGGGGNAQVQVVTKAGGSAYHGQLHLYVRNSIFNANDFFNDLVGAPKPEDDQYAYGGSIGGPVFIPHLLSKAKANTFFFYAFEGRNDAVAKVTNITNLPTQAELNGTFPIAVCYAFTDPAFDCKAGAKTVAGGTIPQTAFDPVAQAYIKDIFSKLPAPNDPNNPNSAILDPVNLHLEAEQFVRIDHVFGSRLNTYFRYVYDPIHVETNAALYANSILQFAPTAIQGISNTDAQTGGMAYELHGTYALTSSTVVDASLSYTPYHVIARPTGAFDLNQAPDVAAALNIPSPGNGTTVSQVGLPFPSQLARVPSISIDQFTYGGNGPIRDINESFQASSNLFHTIGRHSLSFGVNAELYREQVNQGGNNAGLYRFLNSTPLQSLVNFEVGKPISFTQTSIDPVSTASITMAEAYAQDDWKVKPRLTLNVGVRYSFFQQPVAAGNNIGSFEPSFFVPSQAPTIDANGAICLAAPCAGGGAPNPNYNPLNGIVQGGVNSPYGKAVSRQPVLGFQPRIGFAMDVYGDGKTAIRGGYGIYFDQTQLNIVHNTVFYNPADVQVIQFPNPASFANPGAGYNATTTPVPRPAYGLYENWSQPYTMGYSGEVQQQFPHETIVKIGYSGNISRHLVGQIDINQPAQGAYISANLPGGCPGTSAVNNCVINGSNTALLNRIRPFLGYDAIVSENTVFIANYNALQTSYNRRLSSNSRVSLNYTFSKGLTDSQGTVTPSGTFTGSPENSACIICEYGPINFDRRHVFTAHFTYTLPYKRRQHGLYQHVVGGWEVSGIITAASGLPLTPKEVAQDPAGVGIISTASPENVRPDTTGPLPKDRAPHTLLSWTGNAASAAKGISTPFKNVNPLLGRSGNSSVGEIRGPGYQVWNTSIFKNTALKDNMTLQLRLQAFNVFNHVNFQGVNMQFGDAIYGQVTSDRDPRTMELGVKLAF